MPRTMLSFITITLAILMAANVLAKGNLQTEVTLGKALFEDKNLSDDRSVACASCHQSVLAFCDGKPVSVGVAGREGTRNAPSLLLLREHRFFFWDGRAKSLEDQVRFPLMNPVEMGMSSEAAVLDRVRMNPNYVQAFQKLEHLNASQLTLTDIARVIVIYEQSLPSPITPLDQYLDGDASALSSDAKAGLVLFQQAGCSSCHLMNAHAAPLMDNSFHDSSVGLREVGGAVSPTAVRLEKMSGTERLALIATDKQVAALGRFVVTLDAKDIGAFRTPSLRDVAHTAPYMHDGSIATLDEAIERELYYRGLKQGYPVNFSIEERRKLRVFLESASSVQTTINSFALTPKVLVDSRPFQSESR